MHTTASCPDPQGSDYRGLRAPFLFGAHMQIKMIKSTNCDGKPVAVGEVVDATDRDGRFLIALGFAEVYQPPKRGRPRKAPVNRMDDGIDTRDAG